MQAHSRAYHNALPLSFSLSVFLVSRAESEMQQIQGHHKGWSHRRSNRVKLERHSGFYTIQGEMVLTCLKPLGVGVAGDSI